MNLHDTTEWIASAVLTTIGYFTRLAFGSDKLTTKQVVVFYLFCGGVLWITNTFIEAGIIRSSLQLSAGLVIPNIIKGIIRGAETSQKRVSKTVEDAVDNISHKVDDIADAVTGKKDKK